MATLVTMGAVWSKSAFVLLWLAVPLVLVAVAFMRVRWFPRLWFVYCLIWLVTALYMGGGVYLWAKRAVAGGAVVLLVLELLIPIVTMVYIVRSRRMRVTYRHELGAGDPAAVPSVFDRAHPNETPTDATDHARERAALRRVTQELSSGVLDTQTWVEVVRHHATSTDSARTTAYVRARMAVLCPPLHEHPPLGRTLLTGLLGLVVSLVVAALLAGAAIALALKLPAGDAARLGMLITTLPALTLSWLAGLFAGARFLRSVA